MKKIKFIFGWIWTLPISIFGFLLCLFLMIFGQIGAYFWNTDLVLIIDLKNEGWFHKKFFEKRDWIGFSCGSCVFVKDVDNDRWDRTIRHEIRHCYQQYFLGILFPFAYIINSVVVWLFIKEKHSYYDNWFEIDARRYAGQSIYIPKSQWHDGPNDRWSWW